MKTKNTTAIATILSMIIFACYALIIHNDKFIVGNDANVIKNETTVEEDIIPVIDTIEKEDLIEYTYTPTSDDLRQIEKEFPRTIKPWAEDLVKELPDIIGWIRIPGFKDGNGKEYINYPVMKYTDNDYYLKHDIYGNPYESGCVFVDFHNTIDEYRQSDNIVIYGHHMRNLGTTFTHLAEYKGGVEMLQKYPIIEFKTIYEEDQEYAIVSIYIAAKDEDQDPNLFSYWRYYDFNKNITDDSDTSISDSKFDNFDIWKERTLAHSWYNSDIECTIDDQYITLQTCSNETPQTRLVIVAKKLTENDDREKILSSYTDRPDEEIYFPPVWVNWWGNHKKYLGWNY